MERWKINLAVLWFGQFFVMSGMTMIVPFLPLYIQEMGVTDPHEVAVWAGVIFAGNFITAFLFQPFWGKVADRYGRKVMLLRSGFGMAAVMTLMGFAVNPWQLLLLRVLNGTISGFVPAAVALMSASAPKERMGFAMGTLQSGMVAGTILGPVIGGVLAEISGFRPIFYITGGLLFTSSLLALLTVKDKFDKKEAAKKPSISVAEGFRKLAKIRQIPVLLATTFIIQFSMMSSMPLMPLFVQQIHGEERLALFSGLVGSVTGFSNMIASPLLGKLSDRIGGEKILIVSLIGAAIATLPQAFVTNVGQLLTVRFILGLFIGGMIPTVNSLIRKFTPDGMESRAYGFGSSSLSLGNMLGPTIGGAVSGLITIQGVFVMATGILLCGAAWAYVQLRERGVNRSTSS
ncbi:MFS transporter [Paenibacillus turpanensis]|uniref:MFS transporter n=1 Tax=Paenibacillus turpanensis TaxID=2689078 RepID=UPI00140961C3|nr:MFS transporter [Paenibacillus turpanensis]